ncbi:MAG: helix-turn-helix domain-containing protein, partial [Burkholderiales bacterium]
MTPASSVRIARQPDSPSAGTGDADTKFLHALGERVRHERSQRNQTRRTLAENSRVSERYVAQIESGKGNISVLLLRKIANALNLPLAELLQP